MNLITRIGITAEAYLAALLKKLWHGRALKLKGIPKLKMDTQLVLDKGTISIEKHVSVNRRVSFSAVEGGNLTIGGGTTFNRNCIIICQDRIQIGAGCKFGPNVVVYDHDHKFDATGIQPGFKTGPIIIEPGCWIGAGAVILRDTHIGTGSIIGAGTVVKGEIPPHSLVTGDRNMVIRPITTRE